MGKSADKIEELCEIVQSLHGEVRRLATQVNSLSAAMTGIAPSLKWLAEDRTRDWQGIVSQLNENTKGSVRVGQVLLRLAEVVESLPRQKSSPPRSN